MLWRSREPGSARPSLLPARLRFVRYRVPIHDRDITKKYGESADINQKNFHGSPLPGHAAVPGDVSIGRSCSFRPLHLDRPPANCSGHPPEQFAGPRARIRLRAMNQTMRDYIKHRVWWCAALAVGGWLMIPLGMALAQNLLDKFRWEEAA